MKLISLTMHNFMPYRDAKLEFPGDRDRNVLVVFGNNMRGKTSILHALRWTFYGRALGRHLQEVPLHEMLNREAASEGIWSMWCRVEFEVDGHKYDLRRTADKRSYVDRPTRPEDIEVQTWLLRDGAAIPAHLVEAEINRFAPEQVSRFFLFDGELLQEYETLLIEGNRQGEEIKDAIEQVLGVPTLVNGREEVSALLKSARKKQNEDLRHIESLRAQAAGQAQKQALQESTERDLEGLRLRHEATRSERSALDDELQAVESFQRAKVKLDSLKARELAIASRLKEIKVTRQSYLRDAWKDLLKPKFSALQKHLLDRQTSIMSRYQERGRLEARANDLRKTLSTSQCPACGQVVPDIEDSRKRAGAELGQIETALKELSLNGEDLNQTSSDLKELSRLNAPGVGEKLIALERETINLEVEQVRVDSEESKLVEELHGFDTADLARKRSVRDGLLKEEARIERDMADAQRRIEELRKELQIIDRTLQAIPAARASRSTAMVKLCDTIESIFSRSIERLRDDLRQHVAERATEAFLSLTTQKDYKRLDINDNYGLSILDDHNQPVNLRSAGAEQIVALSLIDALARTGRSAGPVVMDTPFARLDLRHRDNILRYLPRTSSQLILLVHDGEIRRESDLAPIASRIGGEYSIEEVNARHSKLEKVVS